jgi:hypothetical protein
MVPPPNQTFLSNTHISGHVAIGHPVGHGTPDHGSVGIGHTFDTGHNTSFTPSVHGSYIPGHGYTQPTYGGTFVWKF